MTQHTSILDRFRPYIERHLFTHLTESGEEIPSERRNATVIFADLSGFTAMSEKMDPEEVAELTNEALEALGRPVIAGDGTIDKYIGDALMAVFGAPVSHADDPRRALTAAIEMRRAIRSLGKRGIAVSIGIHSGLVVSGNIGGRVRREYSVLGDTVNVASRLEGIASRGEILVSDETRKLAGPAFTYGAPRRSRLKGRVDEVTVWPLIGRKQARVAKGWRFSPVFLGRAETLRRLEEGMRRDATQIVVGVAGSGKSTLLERLGKRAAQRGRLLRAAVKYGTAQEPHLLIRGIAAAARSSSTGLEKRAAMELEKSINESHGDPGRICKALSALAADRKRDSLLFIEDLHLADEASLLVLGQTGPIPGMAVVATARPSGAAIGALGHAETVELSPLNADTSLEMVRRLLRAKSLPANCLQIAEQTEGVPLAIEELVRYLVDQGMLYRERGGSEWRFWGEVPGDKALFSIIRSRLDALSPRSRSLVSRVAVFGIACPWQGDHDPLALRPSEGALDEAEMSGVLRREGGEIVFVHDHYRHVAYHSQLFRVRRDLHRRAAEWFIAEKMAPEVIADHLVKSGELDSAGPFLRLAADRAVAGHAHQTACQCFDELRGIARKNGRRRDEAEALLGIAASQLKLSRFAETASALRSAAAIIRREQWRDLTLTLMSHEANLCKNIGKIAEMKRLCRAILRSAPSRLVAVRAAALQTLGAQEWRDGSYRDAVVTYERILRLKVPDPSKRLASRRLAAGSLLDLYRMTGDFRKAERLIPLALSDIRAGWPLLHIGRIRLCQGRLDDAEKLLKDAAGRAVKNKDARLETLTYRELARWELERGRIQNAIDFLERGIERARHLPAFRARAHAEAAVLFSRVGDYARSRSEAAIAGKLNEKLPLAETRALLLEAAAHREIGEGRRAEGKRIANQLLALRVRQGAGAEVKRVQAFAFLS